MHLLAFCFVISLEREQAVESDWSRCVYWRATVIVAHINCPENIKNIKGSENSRSTNGDVISVLDTSLLQAIS